MEHMGHCISLKCWLYELGNRLRTCVRCSLLCTRLLISFGPSHADGKAQPKVTPTSPAAATFFVAKIGYAGINPLLKEACFPPHLTLMALYHRFFNPSGQARNKVAMVLSLVALSIDYENSLISDLLSGSRTSERAAAFTTSKSYSTYCAATFLKSRGLRIQWIAD